jgi:hypothetical protein
MAIVIFQFDKLHWFSVPVLWKKPQKTRFFYKVLIKKIKEQLYSLYAKRMILLFSLSVFVEKHHHVMNHSDLFSMSETKNCFFKKSSEHIKFDQLQRRDHGFQVKRLMGCRKTIF